MNTYCFTFGCGSPLARYYVELQAENETQARLKMIYYFDRHWAGVYLREDFERQIKEYGYQRLDLNEQAGVRLQTNYVEPAPAVHEAVFP